MKQKRLIIGAVVAVAAGALAYAIRKEQYQLEVNEYSIGNESRDSAPLRLLQLSDLHLRHRLDRRHYHLADTIASLKPDLIIITGDALDKRGVVATLDQFLGLLPPQIPKAAIMGNHDYRSGALTKTLKQVYSQHNGDLLINASKTYLLHTTRITITGLDDCIKGDPQFARAVQDIGNEAHHVVLIHTPLQQDDVLHQIQRANAHRTTDKQLNISYLFAGHTHGGQVRVLGYTPYLPKQVGHYLNGWYNSKRPYLYVSKGFGNSFLPIRWGARSEVTLFNYYV